MWKLKFVKIVPLIISMEGITTRTFIQSMKILKLPDGLVTMKRATIRTADLPYCTKVLNCKRLR